MYQIKCEDVISADLLTVEEASKLPRWIRANGEWWWLRSPGYRSNDVAGVSSGGSDCFNFVDDDDVAVRPALRIKHVNLDFGETVEVFGEMAQYIGDDKVLLCDVVAKKRFDGESNDYEESEIKSYLDSWLDWKRENMEVK